MFTERSSSSWSRLWPVAIILVLLSCQIRSVHAQGSRFNIFKGDEKIGSIQVSRSINGSKVSYSMVSHSEFRMVWMQVVHTRVAAVYLDGLLTSCHSSVRVNDSVKDSSNMVMRDGIAQGYIHPDGWSPLRSFAHWTTSRMYFEEPVGIGDIFVESVLKDCKISASGVGRYTLTFPNDSRNHYLYVNGQLQEIYVERTFFDLVFRRA